MTLKNTSNADSRSDKGSVMLEDYLIRNDDPWTTTALRAAAVRKSRPSQEKKGDSATPTARGFTTH